VRVSVILSFHKNRWLRLSSESRQTEYRPT